MDYARHQCRVQHLQGWEEDLLNEMIADLLTKDEKKLNDMLSRTTKKTVNGQPTTELDKFVLKMIKMNATSKFTSFRKNTLGQKIIANGQHVEVAQFTELTAQADRPDESTYNAKRAKQLDRMHCTNISRLREAGYPAKVIEKYTEHFIESRPAKTANDKKIIESLTEFLTKKTNTLCLL